MDSLQKISEKLLQYHTEKKEVEDNLAAKRKEFFERATAEVAKKHRKSKVVEYTGHGRMTKDYIAWIAQHHPGYILHGVDTFDDMKIIRVRLSLIEDPALKKFIYSDGDHVYVRNVQEGAKELDVEKLQAAHPDVWKRITKPVPPTQEQRDLVADVLAWSMCDFLGKETVDKFFKDQMMDSDWPRELDYDKINVTDQQVMEEFMIPGEIKLRLEVKEVKAEEDEDE